MAPTLDLLDAFIRIGLAAVLAGAVGLERELRDQDAGLRTHMLVGTGAAVFVVTANYGWEGMAFGNEVGVVLDPSRIVAYIVTGIGFLGGGAILKHGLSVKGLTTAASLWVVAAIGAAAAAGLYVVATGTAAIVLLSLWPLKRLSAIAGIRSGQYRLSVDIDGRTEIASLTRVLERLGAVVVSLSVTEQTEGRSVELVVGGIPREEVPGLVDALLQDHTVETAAWVR